MQDGEEYYVQGMKWMMLYSWALPTKKRLKHSREEKEHSVGGTADIIVSEAGKKQPCSWKE